MLNMPWHAEGYESIIHHPKLTMFTTNIECLSERLVLTMTHDSHDRPLSGRTEQASNRPTNKYDSLQWWHDMNSHMRWQLCVNARDRAPGYPRQLFPSLKGIDGLRQGNPIPQLKAIFVRLDGRINMTNLVCPTSLRWSFGYPDCQSVSQAVSQAVTQTGT